MYGQQGMMMNIICVHVAFIDERCDYIKIVN